MPCKSAHTYTKNSSCRISLSSCKLRGLCMYHDFKRKTGRFIKQKIIWVSQRMVIFGVDLTRSNVNSQPANLHLSGRVCYCYARTWSWRHHGEVVRHQGRVWLCWNPYVNRYLGAIEAVASIQNICSCQKEVETVDHFLFLCLTNFTVPDPIYLKAQSHRDGQGKNCWICKYDRQHYPYPILSLGSSFTFNKISRKSRQLNSISINMNCFDSFDMLSQMSIRACHHIHTTHGCRYDKW